MKAVIIVAGKVLLCVLVLIGVVAIVAVIDRLWPDKPERPRIEYGK